MSPASVRPRFAILGSGRGSNAAALMNLFQDPALGAELVLVLSNVRGAPILEKAAAAGYRAELIESAGRSRPEHESLCLACLQEHGVEHLLLAGYMRILSADFLRRFPGVILNIHPSLLPDFPGLSAAAAQWQAGVAVAGATVHVVDAGVDTGPVVLSGSLDVRGDEGEEGLAARILSEVEHVIYPRAVRLLVDRMRRGVPLYTGWTGANRDFPARLGPFDRHAPLRYGENPHQRAFLYVAAGEPGGVAHGAQLAGKELSYNNYLDLDAAYRAVYPLGEPACAIIKHTNPCGLAEAESQDRAFAAALAADPVAAFGSVLGFNRPLTAATVQKILDAKLFVECIVAPGAKEDCVDLLAGKPNLRLVTVPPGSPVPPLSFHRIGGGLLVQESDSGVAAAGEWKVVTQRLLEPGWEEELRFAMHAAGLLRSNAIAISAQRTLFGSGTGQMSRIDAALLAISKAGERARGAFLGSDAFFPFADCVEAAAAAGIAAIVQPGGSVRDAESIAACDKHGMAMVFTGRRHFRH